MNGIGLLMSWKGGRVVERLVHEFDVDFDFSVD
jgi:hypothetical protein